MKNLFDICYEHNMRYALLYLSPIDMRVVENLRYTTIRQKQDVNNPGEMLHLIFRFPSHSFFRTYVFVCV